jgi:hypothetical protein
VAAATAKSRSVRVGQRTYELVRRLGAQSGRSITQVIEDAVAEEARRAFWHEFHGAVERLQTDREASEAYGAERRALEGTLMDGLDPDDDWTEQFNAAPEAFTFPEDRGSASLEDEIVESGVEDGPKTLRAPR